jgi:hypothetical protein
MDYAKTQGPAVGETLKNVASAISTILQGSAEAGPGMLTVVNAMAKLVAALPPAFVGRVLQVYAALKLYKLANSGITAVSGAVTTLSGRLTVLRTASAGAGGGIAGVRAALATLSTGAKIGGAIAVVAGVVLVLQKLSESSKKAPDVDRMTTAIGRLAQTGKASGELTRVFGASMDGLGSAIDRVSGKASGMDKFNDAMNKVFTLGMGQSNSMKDAKKQIDSIDKGLASLVSSGHADQAAAALKDFKKAGFDLPKDKLDNYNSALADSAFEAKLTANSMGMFGDQAQKVQKQLDAQKQAAQGLQQAILDLNDANRAGLDTESAYQQSIDDATKAIKGHHNALTMSNGALNLNTQAARDAYGPLSKIAETAMAASVATLQQTGSQDKANRVLIDAHAQLVRVASKMGLSTKEANKFADSLDNIKDPKIQVTANIDSAQARANAIKDRIDQLSKMKATPKVRADLGRSEAELANLKQQIAGLKSKSVFVTLKVGTSGMPADVKNLYGFGAATGAVVSHGVRRMAEGGMGRPAMMARGGSSILWGEGGDESYIPHDRRPRSKSIAERTVSIMGGSVNWGGTGGGSPAASAVPLGAQVAKGLWQGMDGQSAWLAAQAKAFAIQTIPVPIADALGISSPSKVAMSLGRWVGAGMVQGLTGSTASVKSATLRLTRSIEQVFHDDAKRQIETDKKQLASLAGTKGKKAAAKRADLRDDIRYQQHLMDSGIAKYVATDNARLLKLAAQRDSVAGKLKAAQTKLSDLQKSWTSEKASVASSILQGTSLITTSPQEGAALTGADVLNNLKAQAARVAAFSAQLEALKKKGLSATLIEQLASAGVDQGGATAGALAAASSDTIKQINNTQKGMTTSANAAGATVADAMYGAGIASAKGLIKGLQSQEASIDKQMLKIAKSMEKAIKAALGIKSPSTVMAAVGDNSAKSVALGINRSTKHAVIAARGMAMSVRQGAAMGGSLTGALGGAVGVGVGSGGGGVVIHNHYQVDVTVEGSVQTERNLVEGVRTGLLRGGLRNNNMGLVPKR